MKYRSLASNPYLDCPVHGRRQLVYYNEAIFTSGCTVQTWHCSIARDKVRAMNFYKWIPHTVLHSVANSIMIEVSFAEIWQFLISVHAFTVSPTGGMLYRAARCFRARGTPWEHFKEVKVDEQELLVIKGKQTRTTGGQRKKTKKTNKKQTKNIAFPSLCKY